MQRTYIFIAILVIAMLWTVKSNSQSNNNSEDNIESYSGTGTDLESSVDLTPPPPYASYPEVYPSFDNAIITERLSRMSCNVMSLRFSSGVRSFVNTYAIKRHESTEVMLGKRSMYFPIFEEYLSKYGLPSDLKNLPILESALKPNAVSRAGAVGLWQFMPATGKSFGLAINSSVDERKDPNKSSDAAARFLKELHRRYGDWALALAAYNAGPGRVNKAMKKARSKDFWTIQKYLPKETRSYVPGFIAATYITHYHNEHGLIPVIPDYSLQVTETTKVYNQISFSEISNITGISYAVIQELNPSYNNGLIPGSQAGNYLILPYHGIGAFIRHIHPEYRTLDAAQYPTDEQANGVGFQTVETQYTVYNGDDINQIAKMFKCKPENIKVWNNLTSNYLQPGQVLKIYERVAYRQVPRKIVELSSIQLAKATSISEKNTRVKTLDKINIQTKQKTPSDSDNDQEGDNYMYYSIRRGESIKDIADRFPGVSIEDILNDNAITSSKQVKSGRVLLIRQM